MNRMKSKTSWLYYRAGWWRSPSVGLSDAISAPMNTHSPPKEPSAFDAHFKTLEVPTEAVSAGEIAVSLRVDAYEASWSGCP